MPIEAERALMTDKYKWDWKWNHGLEVMEDSARLMAVLDEPRALKLYRASIRLMTLTEDQFPSHLRGKLDTILKGIQGRPARAEGVDVNEIHHELVGLICDLAFEMNRLWARSHPDST